MKYGTNTTQSLHQRRDTKAKFGTPLNWQSLAAGSARVRAIGNGEKRSHWPDFRGRNFVPKVCDYFDKYMGVCYSLEPIVTYGTVAFQTPFMNRFMNLLTEQRAHLNI